MNILPILSAAGSLASLFQPNPYKGLINEQTGMAKLFGGQARQWLPQINQQYGSIMGGNLPPEYEAFYNQMLDSIKQQYSAGRKDLQGDLAGSGLSSSLMDEIMNTFNKEGSQASSSAAFNSMLQRWKAMDEARGALSSNITAGAGLGTSAAGTAGNLIGAGQAGQSAANQGLMALLQQFGLLDAWKKYNSPLPPGGDNPTPSAGGSILTPGAGSDWGPNSFGHSGSWGPTSPDTQWPNGWYNQFNRAANSRAL